LLADESPSWRDHESVEVVDQIDAAVGQEEVRIRAAQRRLLEFELIEHKVFLGLAVALVAISLAGVLLNPGLLYGVGLIISAVAGLAAVLLRRAEPKR